MRFLAFGVSLALLGCGAILGLDDDPDGGSSSSGSGGSSSSSGEVESSSGGASSGGSSSSSLGGSSSGNDPQSFDSSWEETTLATGISSTSLWVVEDHIYALSSQGVHHRTPAGDWSLEPSSPPALYQIWGRTPNDVWAVGFGASIMHRDATNWSSITSGIALPPTTTLSGVWGFGNGELYAVGDGGVILHRDPGGGWTKETCPSGDVRLQTVWGSSPSDVYVVNFDGLVLHSRGNGLWKVQRSADPEPTNLIGGRTIWGSSPNDVYLSTAREGLFHSSGDGNWSAAPGAGDVRPLSLSGLDDGTLFVSGFGRVYRYEPAAQRWRQSEVGPYRGSGLYGLVVTAPDRAALMNGDGVVFRATSSLMQ